MKKVFYPVILITLALAVAVIVTFPLLRSRNVSSGSVKTEETPLSGMPTPSIAKSEPSKINLADLRTIRKYAESYEPKPEKNTVIASTPKPNEKVLQAISNLANSPLREHEKYVVLIFLRLYRFHTEHFKQGYALGRNTLDKEFYRLTGESYDPEGEPEFSGLAPYWVEKNPGLLKYPLIEKEMKRIEKAGEKIKKELDETTRKQEKRSR